MTFLLCCLLAGCSVHPISHGPSKYRWVSSGQDIRLERCILSAQNECQIETKKLSQVFFADELFQAYRIPGGAPPSNRYSGQKVPSKIVDARIAELTPAMNRLEKWQPDLPEKLKSFPELGQTNYEKLDAVCYDNNEVWKNEVPKILRKYSGQWWDPGHSVSRILAGHFMEKPLFPAGVSVVAQRDWVLLMGDSPYALPDGAGLVGGVSPQHAEVFMLKTGQNLRLPNSIDWHMALLKNPALCKDRYWIKNGQVYFMSPKCNEDKLRDRAPWTSIKVMKLAVMKDE